jgi:hypothetical protein
LWFRGHFPVVENSFDDLFDIPPDLLENMDRVRHRDIRPNDHHQVSDIPVDCDRGPLLEGILFFVIDIDDRERNGVEVIDGNRSAFVADKKRDVL